MHISTHSLNPILKTKPIQETKQRNQATGRNFSLWNILLHRNAWEHFEKGIQKRIKKKERIKKKNHT